MNGTVAADKVLEVEKGNDYSLCVDVVIGWTSHLGPYPSIHFIIAK